MLLNLKLLLTLSGKLNADSSSETSGSQLPAIRLKKRNRLGINVEEMFNTH